MSTTSPNLGGRPHRLSNVAPELVILLANVDDSVKAEAARWVSAWAIDQVGRSHVEAAGALTRSGGDLQSASRAELERTADELDRRAWNIQEQVESGLATAEDYELAFSRARAVSSLAASLDEDPLRAATESVYEAFAATGRLDVIRDWLTRLLSGP